MKISVIIPCFNGERYLSECLNSVLCQDMADFELLLIDDGSTDGTLDIARHYAQRDARVRVLHQPNAGVSAARNLGLDHASGEWVTFVDCDDLLVPGALGWMLNAATDGVDMVVCAHETFDAQGNRETVYPQTCWPKKAGDARKRAVALRLIEGDCVLNIMCAKLHRRALIEREGLRLSPDVAIAEDALFNLEAVLCGRGVAYVSRVAYRYRTHEASAMHTHKEGAWTLHLPWLTQMRQMLMRRGMLEPYYAAFVDSAVLRLYKDAGVSGVMRGMKKALPLLDVPLDVSRLDARGRAVYRLIRSGSYAAVYPLIFPAQVAHRKVGEAAAHLRAPKERPQ